MDQNLTFLFTDIEGSTQLWERQPEAMSAALVYHDALMAETIQSGQGKIFKSVGDGVCAVFESAGQALQAALTIQQRLHEASNRADKPLLALGVRMGIYSGTAEERGGDYFGTTLNRASRFMSAAHGGQILVSAATRAALPPEIELRDLGMHRLRDLSEPEHIYQAISPHVPPNLKPIRSITPRPTNLPAQLTSFVGRESDVAEVCQRLRQTDVRLVTLMGAGGIGKTRLSIQVGSSLLDEYEDGVFFIPLAPLNKAEEVIKYVAQALKIEDDGASPLLDTLKAQIQSRQMLLIFDNFEHILDAASVLNELLAVAARLKILATSREALFIYGERTYTVPPLKLPEAGQAPDKLLQSSAAKLFVERIQAMQPEFAMSETSAPDVVKICRQLEGLPLALELAAARIRDLTLQEIAKQIEQRLALLSKGPRDMPTRQQTMRGAIDWSYHLLSAEDQRTFARLSVFESPFYGQAADAVTSSGDLKGFKNKSLLQQSGEAAFSMLAVIREYAMEKLGDFGETEAMRQKHGLYYCGWLEGAQEHLIGRDQVEWFDRLNIEQHNLRAALEWFLRQEDIENAGRLVGILWRYWATQSLLSEGEQRMHQVLTHADKLSPRIHARVTQGAGRLAFLRHEYARATSLQQISLTLYKSIDDKAGQAAILLSLGEAEYAQGHTIQAENYIGASLDLFRELNDQAGIGRCLNNMGRIVRQNGEFSKAEPYLRESLALARERGSSEGTALALYDLAGVLRDQEHYPEAEGYYRESLALYQELNFTVGVAVMLYNLGFARQGQGDYSGAMQHFLEALKLLQPLEEATIAVCLIGIAGALLHVGNRDLSVKTLSAAKALMVSKDAEGLLDYADQVQYDRLYAEAHVDEALGKAAWTAGQSMPLETIIKEILAAAPRQQTS